MATSTAKGLPGSDGELVFQLFVGAKGTRAATSHGHVRMPWEKLPIWLKKQALQKRVDKEQLAVSCPSFVPMVPAKDKDTDTYPKTRRNTDVAYVTLLGLDYDRPVALQTLLDMWGDWACVIVSTFSATDDAPRWRVFVQLDRWVTRAEYPKLWAWANDRSNAFGAELDGQCKNPNRLWFYSWYAEKFTVRRRQGPPLILSHVLTGMLDPERNGAPNSEVRGNRLSGGHVVRHAGGTTTVSQWAQQSKAGDRLQLYCPMAPRSEETTLGSAVLFRRASGVFLWCSGDEAKHKHPSPQGWWWQDPEVTSGRDMDVGVLDKLQWDIDKQGNRLKPKKNLHNLDVILTSDFRWKDEFWWDDRRLRPMMGEKPLADHHEALFRLWVERNYNITYAMTDITESIRRVCMSRPRNLLQEELEALTWDGTSRVEGLAQALRIVTDGEDEYRLAVSMLRCFLIQAVARAFAPGCKAEGVLILMGGQGEGKSTVFETLAGREWFADSGMNLENKDSYLQLAAAWIYEWPELDSMRRVRNTTIKSFLSSREDTFRGVFARNVVPVARHTVIVGSTNKAEFLTDDTGDRRYWPVRVGDAIDLAWVEQARNQLWAEAVHMYRQHTLHAAAHGARTSPWKWWLTREQEELRDEFARAFRSSDSWASPINAYLDSHPEMAATGVRELLETVLDIPLRDHGSLHQSRVKSILLQAGWTEERPRVGGARPRVWARPGVSTEDLVDYLLSVGAHLVVMYAEHGATGSKSTKPDKNRSGGKR